jgi:hypothetical protein
MQCFADYCCLLLCCDAAVLRVHPAFLLHYGVLLNAVKFIQLLRTPLPVLITADCCCVLLPAAVLQVESAFLLHYCVMLRTMQLISAAFLPLLLSSVACCVASSTCVRVSVRFFASLGCHAQDNATHSAAYCRVLLPAAAFCCVAV